MGSPSDDPPNGNPPNTVSQSASTNHDHHDLKEETEKEKSPTSVFVNSEPIREDQVQNAVRFLSHPKVKGSPVIYRRSFLERKGLTKEEIDEAFRRVPDSTPAATTTQSPVANKDGQIKTSSSVQPQTQAQTLQPKTVGRTGSISGVGLFSQFRWYHGVLAVSFLAVSGAGTAIFIKNAVVPRLKSWVRRIVLEEGEEGLGKKNIARHSVAEEAAAAAKAAATAAADVARASQEMLKTRSEEKRCFEELISMLHVQVNEMKSMSSALQKLDASGHIVNGRVYVEEQTNQKVSRSSSRLPYANGNVDSDFRTDFFTVRSLSPPTSVEPSAAPHPKSYMEIMAMIQRGEKPSNIREINDAPPNPNQPLPNPRVAPKPKPWEFNQAQYRSGNTFPVQVSNNGTAHEFHDDQINGDNRVPWLQPNNGRITEIEAFDEQKFESPSVLSNERHIPRSWVPPQLPPVAMAETAAAIRQPKTASSQTEHLNDEQLLARLADVTDELQKVTKFSETGGSQVVNGENPGLYSTEIQGGEKAPYLET